MVEALERYTKNYVEIRDYSQNNVTFALASALNSQDILLSQLYYGQVMDELDTTQPYADITQVKMVPDINGNVRYIFYDKTGAVISGMTPAVTADFNASNDLIIGTGQANRYDLATGQVTRAAVSTDPWFNKRGLLVIKPTEGAALVQKNEELGRASNVIQILASIISAQNSARSAWINALR